MNNKGEQMKKLFTVLLGLMLAASLFSMSSQWTLQPTENITQPHFSPDSGTPDTFGYVYVMSGDPGGPTFNWIDISTIGTEVTGLEDDNVVGPFPIGFDFPYYWYTVDQVFVGSNGYIYFSGTGNLSHPFHNIPDNRPPNDLITPYTGDLQFDGPGDPHCYIYTSATLDTFIVSFITVPEWDVPNTEHTFQIILTKSDSVILMQYGKQVGDYTHGTNPEADMAGIEDVTGTIGLQFFRDGVAGTGAARPDSGMAVSYIPPLTTTLEVHDLAPLYVDNVLSGGIFRDKNTYYTPTARIKNFGNQTETGVNVILDIKYQNSTAIISSDTVITGTLNAFDYEDIAFNSFVLPDEDTVLQFFVRTYLTGDMTPQNDSINLRVTTATPPGWLRYLGYPGDASAWSGDSSGYGMEYVPPVYPFTLDSISFQNSGNPGDVEFVILDDDGTNNGPGTVLFSQVVNISDTGWFTTPVSPAINITDGSVYAGVIVLLESTVAVQSSMDGWGPVSRRAWEFTTGWAPSRDASTKDVFITVHGTWDPVGIEEEVKIGNTNYRFVGPSVISGNTFYTLNLSENSNVNINVFDLSGRQVQTLYSGLMNEGTHSIGFDNSQISSGVYFIRADVNGQSESVKINIIQ